LQYIQPVRCVIKEKGFCIVLAVSLLCGLSQPAAAADTRTLAREAAAAIRAVENMQDNAAAAAKLKEIRAKLDQIRAADSNFAELCVLESKYKRLTGLFGAPPPVPSAPAAKTGAPAASAVSGTGAVSSAGKEEALKDWQAIVALKEDFLPRLEGVIPVHVKNIIYDGEHADEALARIAALQQEAPAVKAKVVAFGAKYGRTGGIDPALFHPGGRLGAERDRPQGGGGQLGGGGDQHLRRADPVGAADLGGCLPQRQQEDRAGLPADDSDPGGPWRGQASALDRRLDRGFLPHALGECAVTGFMHYDG